MDLRNRRESSNIEDATGGGGGGGNKLLGGGIGIILVIVISLLTGKNPLALMSDLQNVTGGAVEQGVCQNDESKNEELKKFARQIVASTEDVWAVEFQKMGQQYPAPVLQYFCGQTQTACGRGSAAMGPFYCPADNKAYIDLAFYSELQQRFKAPGDFAMAYVIAHEVGHHIQNVMGISEKAERSKQGLSEAEANRISVKVELQADFLAGVWAHYAQKDQRILQEGDIEEALNAAHAIGDDNLQRQAQGYIVPDGFTHGTSAQRMYWFKKGFETGDINQGNTFQASDL
jgi:predicted metalloprotease